MDSSSSGEGLELGFCVNANEPSGFKHGSQIHDHLTD